MEAIVRIGGLPFTFDGKTSKNASCTMHRLLAATIIAARARVSFSNCFRKVPKICEASLQDNLNNLQVTTLQEKIKTLQVTTARKMNHKKRAATSAFYPRLGWGNDIVLDASRPCRCNKKKETTPTRRSNHVAQTYHLRSGYSSKVEKYPAVLWGISASLASKRQEGRRYT